MAVASRKYSRSVPSKQSNTTKCDLSLNCSPLRVPRPSICSKRMRDFTGRRKTMYSRSGMSTPVESMSTVTAMLGAVAEFADALQGPIHGGASGDLAHERVTPPENIAGDVH